MIAFIVLLLTKLHQNKRFTQSLTQYFPNTADKQKLVQNSDVDYTAASDVDAAPHIVIQAGDKVSKNEESDKAPLV